MIPYDLVNEWRQIAPWVQDHHIEQDITVSRAEFERNFAEKLADPRFAEDIRPLLSPDAAWDKEAVARYIETSMTTRLPGHPWKDRPAS